MNHQNENGNANPNENGNANPNPNHPALAVANVENAVHLQDQLEMLFDDWTIIHGLPFIQDYVDTIINFALGTYFQGQNVHFDGVHVIIPGIANAAVGNGGGGVNAGVGFAGEEVVEEAVATVQNVVDLLRQLGALIDDWTELHDLPLIPDFVHAISNFALGTYFHGQNVHYNGVHVIIPGNENANAAVGNGVADGGNVGGVAAAVIEGGVADGGNGGVAAALIEGVADGENGGVAAAVIEGGVADGGNGGVAAAVIEGGVADGGNGGVADGVIEGGGGGVNDELG